MKNNPRAGKITSAPDIQHVIYILNASTEGVSEVLRLFKINALAQYYFYKIDIRKSASIVSNDIRLDEKTVAYASVRPLT